MLKKLDSSGSCVIIITLKQRQKGINEMILKNEIKNEEGRIVAREYFIGCKVRGNVHRSEDIAIMLEIAEEEVEAHCEKQGLEKEMMTIEYLRKI